MRAAGAFAQSSATGDLDARTARAMRRMAAELIGARWATLVPVPAPPFGADGLEFERPGDTAAGVVTWGSRSQILLELATGELDNGLDDDGDGLVDERSIALVQDLGLPSEQRATILSGGKPIRPEHLPPPGASTRRLPAGAAATNGPHFTIPEGNPTLRDIEMKYIQVVLEKHHGNKPAASKELGISLKTLYNKINSASELEKSA